MPTSVTHVAQMVPEDPLMLPFSRVISPTASGTFLPLSSAELLAARYEHFQALGNYPKEDARPSDAQLSGLAAWLRATPNGRRKAPFVHFAVWTAHANVLMEEQTLAPKVWLENGEWVPRRYRGPASFAAWRICWGF